MERRDSAVSPPWETVWYEPGKPPQPLPPRMRILQVFEQIKRKLLILGEPGAGKTTTMLELARELLDGAKADNAQLIPVLVDLSSWKQPEVGIFDWLLAELKGKYGLRQDLGKAWLQSGVLLPLLDGLDEVAPELQQKCAKAINDWLTGDIEQKPCGVLVCCRREEFETIVRQKLSLQGAIYLQPLTAAQIEAYFSKFELQDVWQTVREDAALWDLLVKPLFLSMFGLVQVQGKFDLAAWQKRQTGEAKIEYLFDTYWDAVMSRNLILNRHQKNLGWLSQTYKTKPLPQRKAVRRTLVFIAKGMMREPSIGREILIEKMQPSWLPKRKQKIISVLIWVLIGSLLSNLSSGPIWGLVMGLIRVPITESMKIKTIEKIPVSISKEAQKEICKSLFVYLFIGLFMSLFTGESFLMIAGLIWGLIWGLVSCLYRGLIEGDEVEIQTKITPNQGIKKSLQNMAIVTIIAAIVLFPLKFLLEFLFPLMPLEPDLSRGIISVILFIFIFAGFTLSGGYALIMHIALRLVLALNRYVPLRFDLLLNYCTERLLLQRIGGRYRFMHKLLQDYFAKMELE